MPMQGELTDAQLTALEAEYILLQEVNRRLIVRLYELHLNRKSPYDNREEILPQPSDKVRKQIEDVLVEEYSTRHEGNSLKFEIEHEKSRRGRPLGLFAHRLLAQAAGR